MATRAGATKINAQPGSLLLVVHNFVARSPDELSLAKGDRIELIERDDDFGDGWFLGRHMANGNTGLFPEVYTTPAPRGTMQNSHLNRNASDGGPKTSQGHAASIAVATASTSAVQPQRSVSGTMTTTAQPTAAHAILHSSVSPRDSNAQPDSIIMNSPMMSETLSVIDEHMHDMQAPRPPYSSGSQRDPRSGSLGSAYSTQALERFSHIPGHETDEEDDSLLTEAEVMTWSPDRVAEYLGDQGVEAAHCNVFKEQEITGEVLLAMDQTSLFIKEFELGPVGRRLKTWSKIKILQDEVKHAANIQKQRDRVSGYSSTDDLGREANRTRASTIGSVLPRALSTSSRPSDTPVRSNTAQASSASQSGGAQNGLSSLQPTQALRNDNIYRPSAQTIRAMQHSRRHSSMDSAVNPNDAAARTGSKKQAAIDQQWRPGQKQTQMQSSPNRPAHSHTRSTDSGLVGRELNISSGNLDPPRTTTSISRDATPPRPLSASIATNFTPNDSYTRRTSQPTRTASPTKLQERPSAGTSQSAVEAAWGTTTAASKATGLRSATMPMREHTSVTNTTSFGTSDGSSPLVTKLDYDGGSAPGSITDENKTSSPTTHKFSFFSYRSKNAGLRAISDAVTKDEKLTASADKDSKIDSPNAHTGMATPSSDTTSIDLQKSEAQSRTSQGSGPGLTAGSQAASTRRARVRSKTKKLTSAYTRGLEKKPPIEQMQGCDYSGWMKKKSGSLMTTWKPRLFVLRGRRLSYYYAEDDREEKGLIDISFHRVLPAQNEMLTGIHASLTGAGAGGNSSPTSPHVHDSSIPETAAEHDLRQPVVGDKDEDDSGLFIFKLVPPRTGLAKGVSFTKPTVHYFAVSSRREGRLWMAALMKATIDRDADGVVTTTYNQKTISLARARERKERPPALRESDESDGDGGDDGGGGAAEGRNAVDLRTSNDYDGNKIDSATFTSQDDNDDAKTQGLGIGLESSTVGGDKISKIQSSSGAGRELDLDSSVNADVGIIQAWAEKEAQLNASPAY